MENYSRTDLACEAAGIGIRQNQKVRRHRYFGIEAEEVIISPGEEEKAFGRPAGRYATLHCGKIWLLDKEAGGRTAKAAASVLSTFLTEAAGRTPGRDLSILVAGLGNRFITADSIGPRTVDRITVTAHAAGEGFLPAILGCTCVSAIAPGVLGQTGIEAASLVADAARSAGADAVIAVDALAARSAERLAATVQITDTGIQPGSGMKNSRTAINRESCGVPVIALGVPTVVDCATLIWNALEKAGMHAPSPELHRVLEEGRGYIVSPTETDQIADATASLLAAAINRVLTPALQ